MTIHSVNNVTKVMNKPKLNEAIADIRTTGHFILPGAPMDDMRPAAQPIEIEMPNGTTEKSTHTCQLRIPDVPREAKEAHIVPGLSHSSLVSIKSYAKKDAKLDSKKKRVKYTTRTNLYLPARTQAQEGCG